MFKNIPNIPLKTSSDVQNIKKSCKVAEKTLVFLKDFIKSGMSTKELDSLAHQFILDHGAIPSLKGYQGFPGSICTSVNQIIAHGRPSDYVLCEDDIITIDITVSIDGWHGDAAWTYLIGQGTQEKRNLIKAAWMAVIAGILSVKPGGHLGDIGSVIHKVARKMGCSIVKDFVGHGIGLKMHEEPMIPHIGTRGLGMKIIPGMVFTIEPALVPGTADVQISPGNWDIQTDLNTISAQFEHTIAVFANHIEVLTFSQKISKSSIDFPPYL